MITAVISSATALIGHSLMRGKPSNPAFPSLEVKPHTMRCSTSSEMRRDLDNAVDVNEVPISGHAYLKA